VGHGRRETSHGASVRKTCTNPKNTGKTGFSDSRGTESGTVEVQSSVDDQQLQEIVEAWPRLSEYARFDILTIAREG